MAGLLDVSTTDFVTTIRMNRPPVNALVPELQEELINALNPLKDDDATRVVLLTSAIDRYFMAGADLKSMGGDGGFDRENPETLERVAQMSRRSQAAFSEIEHFPKPLIAAINGHALGGGCELALVCDYRLMIDDGRSTIGQTEPNVGLIPGAGGTQRLPRLVGRARATEMIFESLRLKAPEAASIGLITAAIPADGFHEAALARARKLAQAAPIALRLAKEALLAGLERSPGKGFEVEAENFGKAAMTEDAMIGIMSFVAKQQPEFKGK
ncbi:MAG TPA: enoyl-CoA hydratase-related protein [Candidatus Dormibacteraeota bacterium]|jgi:enoyl-CoA hydratase/carnithine racemase|nr:enoyl-CoA hydratase-related protein [Candidatus Dormibacteraeota bacterium]